MGNWKGFARRSLDKRSVKPMSFPGKCEILKLNGKSLFTNGSISYASFCFHDLPKVLIVMLCDQLLFGILFRTGSFGNVL